MKPTLTVELLLSAGFIEVGCWELNDGSDLVHRIHLPTKAGVYAFAINGLVHYVGLASKSLRQRLGFYRKPGMSQTTNVRLNEVIRGHIEQGMVVQILTAHPPDQEWNGFRISGAEGLEAGLISEFELPWNVRGAKQTVALAKTPTKPRSGERQTGIAQKVLDLVSRHPGMTELEVAKALYGPTGLQPQVNQVCRSLVQRGIIERRGGGGPSDPFVYHAL